MSKDTGGPAFPVPDIYHPNGQIEYGASGMTLRDYFAAAAMQGILAGDHPITHDEDCMQKIAYSAYETADAMLAERAK